MRNNSPVKEAPGEADSRIWGLQNRTGKQVVPDLPDAGESKQPRSCEKVMCLGGRCLPRSPALSLVRFAVLPGGEATRPGLTLLGLENVI